MALDVGSGTERFVRRSQGAQLHAVCRLADYLDHHGGPIHYHRRA